ncbi:hypothetical protein Glove_457g21 [Diversispora epigaea]|uniref:Uncharacterized protein n=1 Tax=Diversispora epigaea TaxID=1348612 RepID=A0A397GTP5_9GLOM|nr:hypothetical protein Glove_457g21 [Diversispora epigaea]
MILLERKLFENYRRYLIIYKEIVSKKQLKQLKHDFQTTKTNDQINKRSDVYVIDQSPSEQKSEIFEITGSKDEINDNDEESGIKDKNENGSSKKKYIDNESYSKIMINTGKRPISIK